MHEVDGIPISDAAYQTLLALGEYYQRDPVLILREQLRISANLCAFGEDPFPGVSRDETQDQRDQWFREKAGELRRRIAERKQHSTHSSVSLKTG